MKSPIFLLLPVAIIYLSGFFLLDRWETTLYYGDSNSYYLHLVSFFIYQDVGDYDKSINSLRTVNPDSPDPREDPYGIRLTDKGRRYIKYTLGVPLMEAPFFLSAHAYASWTNRYPADGWSRPYLLAVGLSTICYVLAGFYWLMRVLERHFTKRVSTFTVLAIALATNLFYHVTYVTMAHGFLFFDYCLLLFLTVKFYERPSIWKAVGIGAVVGLITLTRVPELISILIPLLWGIVSKDSLKKRINFLKKNATFVGLAFVAFLLVFSIQLIYWHYVSGRLIFNPYQGEGFNFLKPRIHKGWFHFSNGWLIYTPIMGFSLLGLLLLKRYFSAPLLPILAFVGLHAYIHYSYYAWTYFPGLGSRPMVETYPLLAFGLAACFAYCLSRKWTAWIPLASLAFFTALNFFQTWQMKRGLIWTERGSWAFYYETFAALEFSQDALRAFDTNQIQPDSTKLNLVRSLVYEGFEDDSYPSVDSILSFQGQYAFLTTETSSTLKERVPLAGVQPGSWLRIGVKAYMRGADRIWNRDQGAMLLLEVYDEKERKRRGIYLRISSHIGNDTYSIWSAGEPDRWGEAAYFMRVPDQAGSDWFLKLHIKNPDRQKLYIDNLRVDHYRRR